MFGILAYFALFVTFLTASGAPLAAHSSSNDIDIRADAVPTVQISLRETKPNTVDWHFALVLHGPRPISNSWLPMHEVLRSAAGKCLEFETREKAYVTDGQLKVTTTVTSIGEDSTSKLEAGVVGVFSEISRDKFPVSKEGFVNCLDWTVMAMEALKQKGYVTEAGVAPFRAYRESKAAAVRAKTDAGTLAVCGITTRALNSKPNTACSRKGAKGRASTSKPPSKVAESKVSPPQRPGKKAVPRPRINTRPAPGRARPQGAPRPRRG